MFDVCLFYNFWYQSKKELLDEIEMLTYTEKKNDGTVTMHDLKNRIEF